MESLPEAASRAAASGAGAARLAVETEFDFRRRLGHPLRVGGIDYLNARPLVETLGSGAPGEVALSNHSPRELARRLRAGELDVALVPALEYFAAPPATEYWILPGIAISSYGAVESIRLFHRVPLGEVVRVALDGSSMASALLTRLCFAERPDERWRRAGGAAAAAVAYETIDPSQGRRLVEGRGAAEGSFDAVLLIGDVALEAAPGPGWSMIDLGTEWTRWTGLPFVYAFWVYRGEPVPGLAELFLAARHAGYARIDRIVLAGPLPPGKSPESCRHYLSHVIRYALGPAELEGLEEFIRRARRSGLLELPGTVALRFAEPGGSTRVISWKLG